MEAMMLESGAFVGTPQLDYETWRALVRSEYGDENVSEPNVFAAWRRPLSLCGFIAAATRIECRATGLGNGVFSEALGRTIRYRDVPLSGWSEKLLTAGVPAHVVKHLSVMTELNKQGRYDRMTDDLFKLTGQKPMSMYDFVKLHAAEFRREATAA
jgi:hypothetical protein